MKTMIEVIKHHSDFALGGERPETVAQEWTDLGLTPEEADKFLQAGCFRADSAAALKGRGISPEQAARRTSAGLGCYEDSVGYKVANGDLSILQAAWLSKDNLYARRISRNLKPSKETS